MQEAGMELLDTLTHTASIGPFDALRHLCRFARARDLLQHHVQTRRPDLVILVDFGDFNLPVVAPLAKRAGCRIVYFISPQIWAWGRFRLRWVKQYVDRMLVFFPFEERFYQAAGVPVTWVGHPLIDTANASGSKEQAQHALHLNPWRTTVGLLPGSRTQEVLRHLPVFVAAARRIAWHMPGVQFVLPKAPGIPPSLFDRIGRHAECEVIAVDNRFYDALQVMDAAVVASGTTTLEAALFEVPMVVVYKTSWPTYLAAKAVVRVPHIAMVNVLMQEDVVPEYIQHRATPSHIATELVGLLRDAARQTTMKAKLRQAKDRLGPPGAIDRAAHAILEELRR